MPRSKCIGCKIFNVRRAELQFVKIVGSASIFHQEKSYGSAKNDHNISEGTAR